MVRLSNLQSAAVSFLTSCSEVRVSLEGLPQCYTSFTFPENYFYGCFDITWCQHGSAGQKALLQMRKASNITRCVVCPYFDCNKYDVKRTPDSVLYRSKYGTDNVINSVPSHTEYDISSCAIFSLIFLAAVF